MNSEEFNEKYEKYLEPGFYGLVIEDKEVIKYLDSKFSQFLSIENFSYSQIKLKFGMARVYIEGVSAKEIFEIESEINRILSNGK